MPRATHCPVQKGAMGTKWQMLIKQVGEDAAWKNWTAYNGFPTTFKPTADLKKELGWGQDMSLDSRNRLISRVNQYNQRNNTSHQVVNVKHPNNPGRWNPELNINYLPYSNDKLQELIRKTYKDNTLAYSSDEFTKLQYSPVKPKAPSLFENPAFQKNDKVKTGVSELFQQNPELSKIGSQEQYSQYLDTIFPDSKVKDIVQGKQFQKLTQKEKAKTIEQVTKEHRSITALKDLAAKLAHRIGGIVEFQNHPNADWKGYNQGMTSVLNEAYMTPDTPFHEILAHPIIRAIKKGNTQSFAEWVFNNNPEFSEKYPFIGAERIINEKLSKEEKEKLLKQFKKETTGNAELYNSLLKELETGRGKEVFEQVKRDYKYKYSIEKTDSEYGNYRIKSSESGARYFDTYEEAQEALERYAGIKYTLEEQQEEALVTLLGLMAADKLDAKKDATLISKLKELWKQISDFVRSLLKQDGIKIDELPITTTLNDLAEIAYGNNKIILPGYKVEYSTPLGNKYDTLEEVNNEVRGLADTNVEVDLSGVKIIQNNVIEENDELKKQYFELFDNLYNRGLLTRNDENDHYIDLRDNNAKFYGNKSFNMDNIKLAKTNANYYMLHPEDNSTTKITKQEFDKWIKQTGNSLNSFIEKNKEYEQSKEIIEQWKKENNIQYDPEEVYSRGQGFYSSIGAYSNLELDLLLKNLIQHIEDNKKAGGEFTISAFTKPIDKRLKHIEGTGDRVRFVIYPKSNHIKWAAPTDVYSGSVWDAHEKVSKDKKSELLGVSFTKAPALRNINEVSPNLADIIDNLSRAHNELGIELTTNNFRIEYDENIDYSTKKLIDNINKILDDKYGKLIKPKIEKGNIREFIVRDIDDSDPIDGIKSWKFKTREEAEKFINSKVENQRRFYKIFENLEGKQPTQTRENTTSIESVKSKIVSPKLNDWRIIPGPGGKYQNWAVEYMLDNDGDIEFFDTEQEAKDFIKSLQNKKIEEKEYTSQAEINLRVAALKEVARKYPRSLITSKVVPINSNMVDNSEIQYSKVGSKQDIEGFKKFTENSPASQKGQSKIQSVINISKGLTAKMGVWHAFITPEQAVELSNGQWNGEAGFYHNGNVYLVDGFIDEDTQVHEFAHPLVRSLMLNNPDVADSLWFQFLEHEEGINILNDVERLYPENFDKDGNPNAAAIEEMLVRAITHEAMKGKKYTGFSKVVRDILKAILDAFHSIFGKEVVDITELKTNTTIKDLAKLMTDDSKIELHRDWYADKNDPSFVRAIEHAVNVANMVGLDFTNVAQEQVQKEADQRYEDRVNHLETYFGKRLLNLRYNDVARAFDITPARNKDTAHLNFWQFEYFQHGFNKKRKDDIEMAENSNTLLSKQVYTSLRYTGFTYGEMVDPLKHNFYNEYLIDAEYEKYKKAHALSQKIMTKWPTQQALQNADPAEVKRDITRLERLGTINGGHVLTKLKQVQMTQFILERVKKENQPGITTRERRNRGTAGTNFFNEVLDAVVFGEKIDDIHSISGLFQSYVFFSADGVQLAQQLIEEKKKEARDHFHYAERELKEKFKAIRTSGADINEIIIKLPDASGEMREYFISSKLPHTGYQNDKLIELQKREKAGDAKAIALIDFLETHYKFMETYGGSDRWDIQTYALPQTGADPIDIFKKYTKEAFNYDKEIPEEERDSLKKRIITKGLSPIEGLKHIFYSESEKEHFLDNIVIKTDRGNMQYAAAKRLVLSDMRKGLFKAAAGALKIKTYRHAASLILDDAKASKDNFAFDVGNNIVVAPKSEPPAGAPFTPNKYRSENIEAILTNYYMGLFYQNALQSNLPSIEYIRDYYGQQHKKNLEKLLDNIIRFRVYKDRRTQKVGAKTGMAIEFMTTWSIWRSLGLNYISMIPNAAAAHGNYFKEYGINGYTSLAYKFFNQVMFGNGKNPFKNITKVYNILHNLEIINTRGHVSLSTSTESLGRLQRILFITTEVVETINQMPFMWYNLDNKYFNDYDDDGILIPGKEGIPAALKLEIERTVMRNNGAYSDASKGAYSYNLEWRTAASLRNWMIAGMTETFGMQKKVADTEYAGFITADVQLAYQTLKKIKEGKFKDVGDIPAYQRLALTKTLRISMLGAIALYGMTMFDTDDDEDKEILNWIKKAFQSVTTFLNWGDTNFKRNLNTISPTIGVLTDLITLVFTSHQKYVGDSEYGKGESKKGADDGDYKLKGNFVKLLPATTIWKNILKEQVKSEKEKDDGPLMLQPIEPIEPVTMEPISNEDE